MYNKNLISCIVPTYNRPKFLERSLAHLFNQTIQNYEVIVIDDCSESTNAQLNELICDSYTSCGMSIRYIKLSENSGTVSIPRLIGLSFAEGATLAHIDDDCFCMSDKLELLYNALWGESGAFALAYGNRKESIYKDGLYTEYRRISFKNSPIENNVGMDNGQFLYKANIYQDIDIPIAINACDWELYKRIWNSGKKFIYIDEYVCDYTWHNNNISKIPKEKRVNPIERLVKFKKCFNKCEFSEKLFNQEGV